MDAASKVENVSSFDLVKRFPTVLKIGNRFLYFNWISGNNIFTF